MFIISFLLLFALHSFAQERGFFKVYEREYRSFLMGDVFEIDEEDFIVSFTSAELGKGELVKRGLEGEEFACVTIDEELEGYLSSFYGKKTLTLQQTNTIIP